MVYKSFWGRDLGLEAVMLDSAESVKSKFRALKSGMQNELLGHGFLRKGSEYVLRIGEGCCIVRFQTDKYNTVMNKKLTVIMGGGMQFLWRAVPIGFDTYEEKYGVVPFGRRLGWSTNEDKWYVISYDTNVNELLADFNYRVNNEIVPFSETFRSLGAVLEDLKSDRPSVPSTALVLKYIEAIEIECVKRSAEKGGGSECS